MRPFDIERDLKAPTRVVARLLCSTSLAYFLETTICGRACWQIELGTEHVQIVFCGWQIVSINYRNGHVCTRCITGGEAIGSLHLNG